MRDHVFRERIIENSRGEEVCRAWDVLAEQDHTYHMSEEEYCYFRQNWWISLYKSGNDTQPVRKRSDFKRALSTLKRLHQETGGDQLEPIPIGSVSNGDWLRVLPPPGGNGKNPGGHLLRIQRKSRKKRQAKACDRTGQPVVYRT